MDAATLHMPRGWTHARTNARTHASRSAAQRGAAQRTSAAQQSSRAGRGAEGTAHRCLQASWGASSHHWRSSDTALFPRQVAFTCALYAPVPGCVYGGRADGAVVEWALRRRGSGGAEAQSQHAGSLLGAAHGGSVLCLVAVPREDAPNAAPLLLSGSTDRTLRLWDTVRAAQLAKAGGGRGAAAARRLLASAGQKTFSSNATSGVGDGACVQTLHGHGGSVTCAAVLATIRSARGLPVLATGSTDCTVRLWHAPADAADDGSGAVATTAKERTEPGGTTGRSAAVPWYEPLRTLCTLCPGCWVYSLAFGATGKVGDMGTLYVADSEGGVRCFLPSSSGRLAASADVSQTAEAPAGAASARGRRASVVQGAAVAVGGATIARGADASAVSFRASVTPAAEGSVSASVSSGPPLAFCRGSERAINRVVYYAEEALVLTLCADWKLRCHEARSGALRFCLENPHACCFTSAAVNAVRRELVLSDELGYLFLLNLDDEAIQLEEKATRGADEPALAAMLCPAPATPEAFQCGGTVDSSVAVLRPDRIDFWVIEREVDHHTLPGGHSGPVIALATGYAGGSGEGLSGMSTLALSPGKGGGGGGVGGGELRVFSAGLDNTLRQWDPYDMACVRVLTERRSEVACMTFVSSRGILATGHDDGCLRLWNVDTGSTINMREHANTVSAVIAAWLRPSEEMVVSGGFDGKVCVWDVRKRGAMRPHLVSWFDGGGRGTGGGSCEVLALLHDAAKQQLLVAGNDGVIRVFAVPSYELLGAHKGHSEAVTCLALDGNFVFSGSEDTSVGVWNSVSASYKGTRLKSLEGHSRAVTAVAVLPDSGVVLSASLDATLLAHDYSSGAVLSKWQHRDEFRCMAIKLDTLEVLVGTSSNDIVCFPLAKELITGTTVAAASTFDEADADETETVVMGRASRLSKHSEPSM